MLLDYLGDKEGAGQIEFAIGKVLASGIKTRDIGGSAGTLEFGNAVAGVLGKQD